MTEIAAYRSGAGFAGAANPGYLGATFATIGSTRSRRSAMSPAVITRFAPSPNGELHLGHAYAARVAHAAAREGGGRFLLRIEDIDRGRCRPEFEARIRDDLAWLGLDWDGPVARQSDRFEAYRAALDRLDELGVLYPCFCTRAEIRAEIAASAQAPHGPDGPLYPGTCRQLSLEERTARRASGRAYALRLDIKRALCLVEQPLVWTDERAGDIVAEPQALGDVVLARKDSPASYHLAVTLDDHAQGITLVTRGRDLFHATHVHRLLQALLGLEVPRYHHHALIRNADGERLSKRDRAMSLAQLRARGASPADIWRLIDDRQPD